MINSSDKYPPEQALNILFENFAKSVEDTLALIAIDAETEKIIASYMKGGEKTGSFQAISSSIKKILDRLTKELITGSGPVSFFDTDKNRLIFIKIKGVIFCIALTIDGSVDKALPYAYLTAEKLGHITEGRAVELDVPPIKVIRDEEEQRRIREHFYELRSMKGTFSFKLIVIGDEGVGKTSLILRHAENKFKKDYLPTLGVSITSNTVELPLRNSKVLFSTWDFGGQKYFRRVRLSYYAGTQACFIVFDLTDRKSFENILKWDREKQEFAGKDIITVLIGNKNDKADERAVSKEELFKFANEHNFTYFETSALTGANVEDAFNIMAYKLVDRELRKVEKKQLQELKEEIIGIIEERNEDIHFGLVRNKKYFSPILQVFLDIDPEPQIIKNEDYTRYIFNFRLILDIFEINKAEDDKHPEKIEMIKNLAGVIGIYDARRENSTDECMFFVNFLERLYMLSENPKFTGSVGILCNRTKYSDYLRLFNLNDILNQPENSSKSIFIYNLSENYLLEIMDNLKMFFTSFSLL
ncbi:MAG: Rab family GTPase [Promethearchaeota archaeon]